MKKLEEERKAGRATAASSGVPDAPAPASEPASRDDPQSSDGAGGRSALTAYADGGWVGTYQCVNRLDLSVQFLVSNGNGRSAGPGKDPGLEMQVRGTRILFLRDLGAGKKARLEGQRVGGVIRAAGHEEQRLRWCSAELTRLP